MVQQMESSEYEEVVEQSEKPVVMAFVADWCPHCRAIRPVVQRVSEMETSVTYCYVDVDKCKDIAERFGVRHIPALVYMKDGKEVRRTFGYRPEFEVMYFVRGSVQPPFAMM